MPLSPPAWRRPRAAAAHDGRRVHTGVRGARSEKSRKAVEVRESQDRVRRDRPSQREGGVAELLIGIGLLTAVPVALATTVLLATVSNWSRSMMWKVTAMLAAVPVAWLLWTHLQVIRSEISPTGRPELQPGMSRVVILLLLPLLAIAGTLHVTHVRQWSTKASGALAACAGLVTALLGLLLGFHQL